MYAFSNSLIKSDCEKDDESRKFCAWMKEIMAENYNNIKQEAEINGHHNHYWYQVRLFYHQMSGLDFGWRLGVKHSRENLEISEDDFYLLNAISDILDLKDYYRKFIDPQYPGGNKPKTGALFMKFVKQENNTKILFGHSSDGFYNSMSRIHKHYNFRYHLSAKHKSQIIPGVNISFTGYPGTIYSADDFYFVNGKHANLVVGGIRIENENKTVWEEVVLDDATILGARVMSANRLAHNTKSWTKFMSYKSAAGIKQWLLVDLKRMNSSSVYSGDLDDQNISFSSNEIGFVWVADQVPGKLHYKDISEDVMKKGYWFSNGAPVTEVRFY